MKTWMVISAYHSDEDVKRILEEAHSADHGLFERILIVDSEGTNVIPTLIKDRGWRNVEYRSYESNLGSGANLRERLRIAAESGADYAWAINHDGSFDPLVVSALLREAQKIEKLGAAYPLSYLTSIHKYNITGTRELPLPAKLVPTPPQPPVLNVFWSSSNGALYSMTPVRHGILPWAELWMGWEDLEYGWRLSDHGYHQVIVCNAVYRDNYEYKATWVGRIPDKADWRSYYSARNLILAVRRSRNQPLFYLITAYRLLREGALILLTKDSKVKRLQLMARGIIDGLRWNDWSGAADRARPSALFQ